MLLRLNRMGAAALRKCAHRGTALSTAAQSTKCIISFRRSLTTSSSEQTAREFTENERNIAQLQQQVAQCFRAGKYSSGLQSAKECLTAIESYYGDKHPAYASALNNVGLAHVYMGDTAAAIEYAEKALKLYEEILGKSHVNTAAALANLGMMHTSMAKKTTGMEKAGHVDAAYGLLEQSLSIREKAFPAGHKQICINMYQLAAAARLQRKYVEAEKLLQGAIALLRKHTGTEDTATATALNNYGMLQKDLKNYSAAEEAYREAINIRMSLLGPKHPETVSVMHNLAELLAGAGKDAEAREVQTEILQNLGIDTTNTSDSSSQALQ